MKLSCKKVPHIVKVMCQLKLIKKTKPEDITRLFLLSASYVLRALLSINLLLCLLLSCSSYGFYGNFIAEHFNTLWFQSTDFSSSINWSVYTNMHRCIEAGEHGFQVDMEDQRGRSPLSHSLSLAASVCLIVESGGWAGLGGGNKYVNAGCSLIHRGAKAVSR